MLPNESGSVRRSDGVQQTIGGTSAVSPMWSAWKAATCVAPH